MKKLSIIILLSLFSLQGMAQGVIKLAPLKLINTKIALGYEHVLNDKITVGGGLQLILPNNLNNFNEGLQDVVLDANGTDITNVDLSGISRKFGIKVTPEFRYYFGGKAPQGFYGLVFLRYTRTAWGWQNSYTAAQTNNEQVNFDISIPLTVGGGGIGLGVQFLIADVATIDWNTGLGFGAYSTNIQGEISAPSSNAINEFYSEIEEIVGEEFLDTVATNQVSEESGALALGNLLLISRLSVGFYIK